MSETEHYKGKLTPTGKTVQEYTENHKIPDYYDDENEYFIDHLADSAIEIDGFVFEVTRQEYNDYDDIFDSTKNDDGTIDFQVKYYNGGCGFSEALQESLK